MPVTQAESLVDLARLTLNDLGPMKWTNLMTDITEFVAMDVMMKKSRVGFDSGTEVEFNIVVNNENNATHTYPYDIDNVNTSDGAIKGKVPFRHSYSAYAYEELELLFNRSPGKIVDLLKQRRTRAQMALLELMETAFWTVPTSTTDTLTPWGLPYWIVYNATDGFTGGAASGFTTVGNINPTTYTRWKNYSFTYTNVTKADLVAKWRRSIYKTNFVSPVEVPAYSSDTVKRGWYTTYNVLATLESLLESQNENLGNDVASKDGQTLFRRNPVIAVPKLDTISATNSDPIYGIPWGHFTTMFLKGEYMKERGPILSGDQHRVHKVFVDLSYNWLCRDRRRCIVGAKAAPF